MKEYTKKPENQSRTLDSIPKTSRQAPFSEILQAYKNGNLKKQPIQQKVKSNNTGLPDDLKAGVENLSGYSMDDVKVHYNSGKPVQLNALAYAQGTDIHVASGQEKYLPHEVWHVVQQKQGRVQPTVQVQGVNVNDNEGLEKEADVMGNKIFSSSIQLMKSKPTVAPTTQVIQKNPPSDDITGIEEVPEELKDFKRSTTYDLFDRTRLGRYKLNHYFVVKEGIGKYRIPIRSIINSYEFVRNGRKILHERALQPEPFGGNTKGKVSREVLRESKSIHEYLKATRDLTIGQEFTEEIDDPLAEFKIQQILKSKYFERDWGATGTLSIVASPLRPMHTLTPFLLPFPEAPKGIDPSTWEERDLSNPVDRHSISPAFFEMQGSIVVDISDCRDEKSIGEKIIKVRNEYVLTSNLHLFFEKNFGEEGIREILSRENFVAGSDILEELIGMIKQDYDQDREEE